MQRHEIQAAGELAGEALAGASALVRGIHEAAAGRAFGATGILGAPVRLVHDGISRAIYAGVRGGLAALPRGGARLVAPVARPTARSAAQTTRGSIALSALNGAFGDMLADRESALALPMRLRRDGQDVPPDPRGLAEAYPDASIRLAVFVHGLCEDDQAWRLLPLRGERAGRRTYGERLQDELGYTPLTLRYNTGRHVSDNGQELARLLEQVVAGWPVPVGEIVLVGHSMGGLVARSACHYAERDGLRFAGLVRHVFCLGSPHLGADLEKAANAVGHALGKLPETRPFARAWNARSVGIKDLRYGSCSEDDWSGCDPDEFLTDRCQEMPFLASAAYYFVGATLSPGPLGSVLGDLLVRLPSASGESRHRKLGFEVGNGRHLPGLTHFDLLNHPAVYEQIRTWLTRRPARRELAAVTG